MKELVCITCPLGCRLTIHTAGEADSGTAKEAAMAGTTAVPAEREAAGAQIVVTGNRCARGLAYAKEEYFTPRRVVTTTCRLVNACRGASGADRDPDALRATGIPSPGRRDAPSLPRRVPCRTTAAFPRERVGELLELIHHIEVAVPVACGTVILGNALGTGIDVVVTRRIP